jgi:hypothetical protein
MAMYSRLLYSYIDFRHTRFHIRLHREYLYTSKQMRRYIGIT